MEGGKVTTKQRQEAEKRVKCILSKCKKFGVSEIELSKWLPSKKASIKSKKITLKLISTIVLTVLGFFIYFFISIDSEDRCWIDMPSMITKATRPPEECTMCSNVKEIKRLSNLTPDEFESEYAYSGVPIVVTDATSSWKALDIFNFWFFKKLYTKTELGIAARDCQFFPYKTEFRSLYDALEMNEERANLTRGTKPWYIGWSNCHDSVAKVLRNYYGRPYFLPRSAENNAVDWIFMGGPGDGAQMHVDNVVHPSWQAQLKGKKRWYISPPPECFYSCISMNVIIHPGEIIVIDTNRWYHKTEVLPGDISITIGAEYD